MAFCDESKNFTVFYEMCVFIVDIKYWWRKFTLFTFFCRMSRMQNMSRDNDGKSETVLEKS